MKIAALVSTAVVFGVFIIGMITTRSKATQEHQHLIETLDRQTAAINSNPADAEAYYQRGLIYRQLNEYENAIEDFTKAIELDPNHAAAYRYRGLTHAFLGNNEQAMRDYETSTTLSESSQVGVAADSRVARDISKVHE